MPKHVAMNFEMATLRFNCLEMGATDLDLGAAVGECVFN